MDAIYSPPSVAPSAHIEQLPPPAPAPPPPPLPPCVYFLVFPLVFIGPANHTEVCRP